MSLRHPVSATCHTCCCCQMCLDNLHIYGSSIHMYTRTHTHVAAQCAHAHTHMQQHTHVAISDKFIHMCVYIHVCVCVCTCVCCFHKYASYQDISNSNNMCHMSLIQGGEDSQESLSVQVIFRKSDLYDSNMCQALSAKTYITISQDIYQPRHISYG